jgi:hypothetical protein
VQQRAKSSVATVTGPRWARVAFLRTRPTPPPEPAIPAPRDLDEKQCAEKNHQDESQRQDRVADCVADVTHAVTSRCVNYESRALPRRVVRLLLSLECKLRTNPTPAGTSEFTQSLEWHR